MTSRDTDKIAHEARYLASYMNTEDQYINLLTYILQRCEQLIADANRATTKRAVDKISSEVYAMQKVTEVLKIKIEFPFDYIVGTAWDSYFEDNAM